MLLGIAFILLAAVLNVVLLIIPLWPLSALTRWLVDLMQKLHWMGRPGAAIVYLAFFVFEIVMAACLQTILWGLAPHAEPRRWTLAVAAFAVGKATLLIFEYKKATSQAHRRIASWFAAASSAGFAILCFLAFVNTSVHAFLASLPIYVFHFIVGGGT